MVLYLLAIWLVAITDSDPARVGSLWQWFISAIGLVATYGGWQRMQASGGAFMIGARPSWPFTPRPLQPQPYPQTPQQVRPQVVR